MYLYLIYIDNKLIKTNSILRTEITDLKITNQKLQQDNIDFLKSPGAAGAGGSGFVCVLSILFYFQIRFSNILFFKFSIQIKCHLI